MSAFSSSTARIATVMLLVLYGAGQTGGSSAAPVIDVTVRADGDLRRHDARIRDAAAEAIETYSEWFGPAPFDRLTLTITPFDASIQADARGEITVAAHWLQPERSLLLEADIARAIARQWWGIAIAIPDQPLADGIVNYAHGRTVERIYDRRHQRLTYSSYEVRYLAGLVPWSIRALRVDRQTAGVGRPDYRRHPDVDLRDHDPSQRAARSAKVAEALLTLEHYIGWPALQRGLNLAAERYRGKTMTTADFVQTISDAADRDLSWFFDPLFGGESKWDYAVQSIGSEPQPGTQCGSGPCIRSTVIVERLGSAAFSGTSHPPSGEFESGRAMEIELEFADGQKSLERWDGRAASKTIVFDGPSPVTRASIDPRNVLALDLTRLNNSRSVSVLDAGELLPWSARWTIWLQDLVLTHAFLY